MVLWSVLPIGLKIALSGMDATTITWYRFLFSAVVLTIFLRARGALPTIDRLRKRNVAVLLPIATVFLAANYISYLIGLHHTTPANAQVLIQMAPLFLALGGIWIFREPFTRVQWLGFGVLVVGLAVFFHDQLRSFAAEVDRYLVGSAMMLLAAVTWAVYGLAQKQLLQWLPSQAIMVCIYGGCTLLFGAFSTPSQVFDMSGLELGMLLFCSLNTIVAYGAFSEALVHWEASRVGAILSLTPLVTIGAAALVNALWPGLIAVARLSSVGLLGACLVFIGSLLTALGQGAERS